MSSFNNWVASVINLTSPGTSNAPPVAAGGPWRPPQWSQQPKYSLTYTPPASGSNPATPVTLFFDGVLRVSHQSISRATRHPVQSGASMGDHVYEEPDMVVLEVGISDAMQSYQSGQYTSASSKSVSAYQTFRQLKALRVPITVNTRLRQYTNMYIEELSAEETWRTATSSRPVIRFGQLILGTIAVNTISARPDQNNTTSIGSKSTQNVPGSITNTSLQNPAVPGQAQPQWNSNTKLPQ